MIVIADTSALVALIDADDAHHEILRELWEYDPAAWVVPWAVLPEVDHLVRRHVSERAAQLFLQDIVGGGFAVEHGQPGDLARAAELDRRHTDLGLGLVDGIVIAIAERLRADAIATLDVRHFAAVAPAGADALYPRDL